MSAGAAVTTVASVTGTLIQLKAQEIATQAQVENDLFLAESKDRQAQEVLSRSLVNAEILEIEAKKTRGQQVAALAKAGRQLGGRTEQDLLEETAETFFQEIQALRREAEFSSLQIGQEAEQLRFTAKARERAQRINRIGTILTGFTGAARTAAPFIGSPSSPNPTGGGN